jgi:lipopolysaccharide export system protein LptC
MLKHRQDLISAAVSILLTLSLAALSFYLAQVAERMEGAQGQGLAPDKPDSFAEGVMLNRTRKNGEPAYLLTASRIEYFRSDDATALDSPVVTSLDPDSPRVTLRALTGRSIRGGDEITVEGSVRLVREAGAGDPEMTVDTEWAQVFPDADIARTDRPVVVRRGSDRLTGIGMEFNNAERTLRVDAQVRAQFTPGQKER